jgi:non-specific serine/threonine protein kinase
MPLAIELAAARLRSMSIDELGERLDHRLGLLTDGSRAALPRHRTLRSMLDWSYDLLTEREQTMFRRVAIFAAGWTLASAEQVCAGDGIHTSDVIEHLTSLVDKSLVMTDEQVGATRYRMLETVRQYALNRLRERGEESQWRNSHLACFAAVAKEFQSAGEGPKQQYLLDQIASETDNLRAALAWSAESSPLEGLRLAANLDALWRIRGHLTEGREWLTRLLNAVPIDLHQLERGSGLHATAMLALLQGDYAAAEELLQESLSLFREINDQNRAARVLGGLVYLAVVQARYPEAEVLARESVDWARAVGDRRLLLSSLGNLAIALHGQGKRAAARELYEQALAVARELGTPWEIGNALNEVGWAECDEGRHELGGRHFAEGLIILHGLGNRPDLVDSLEGLASVAAATGAPQRAIRLWGAADALQREMGCERSVRQKMSYERQVQPVRDIFTAEAFDRAWDEGRAMSLDDAVRYALNDSAGRDR